MEHVIELKDILNYKQIILWGAGSYIEQVISLIDVDKVLAIIDKSQEKWGMYFAGIEVRNPEDVLPKVDTKKTACLISVASYNYEIAIELQKMYGFDIDHIFSFTSPFAEKYMYDAKAIVNSSYDICQAIDLMGDQESKKFLQRCIENRLTRNPICLEDNINIREQYIYKNDLVDISVHKGDVILDCGAYIGDTAEIFLEQTQGECNIICIEPFVGNYNKLSNWIIDEQLESKVAIIQAVLDKEDGWSEIASEDMESVSASKVNEGVYGNQVRSMSIDSIVRSKVDFIKMDIEGAEPDALLGARRTIQKYGPQMMVSAYHRTAHLWELPLLIHKIEPRYHIFCGHQPHAPFEPEFYITL